MPSCTDNPEQKGVWVCPYCSLGSTPIRCYSMHDVDPYDPTKGQVKVPCQEPCTLAGFHGRGPGLFWDHVQEVHGWDGKDPKEEPPRLLDDWEPSTPTPIHKRQLPVPRGPSRAARAKARAKRKKKKKLR